MALIPKGIKRFFLFGVFPLLLVGGIVVWIEREELLHCYYLHRLEKARGEEGLHWATKVASLGERVVPDVIGLMTDEDAERCENARTTLKCLTETWGREDPRCLEMLHQAIKEFPRLSASGQEAILRLTVEWLHANGPCPTCLVDACGRLLGEVAHRRCPSLFSPAVDLTVAVVAKSKEPEVFCAARAMTRAGLTSPDLDTRIRGIKLATMPGVDMRKEIVPLLNDPEAIVRRAAMLAVGEWPDIIHTDNLLAWLHDPDPEVRKMCEQSLRVERRGGLSSDYVRLGKLVTDPAWKVRVSVLDHLEEAEDLDSGAWLRRLSHDPSPAVRAAAIRAACRKDAVDLSDRLDQMARDDPSPTVSSLARHYLQGKKND